MNYAKKKKRPKPGYLFALLLPLAASCVTSDDLRQVAFQVESVEKALADETKTVEEVSAEAAAAKAAIREVAEQVEDRTEGFINGVSQGTEGGILGLLGVLGLHMYRNRTRKKDLAEASKG